MKFLAVFAFVVAVAVASGPPAGETTYRPNKEYVYEYVTEALSGVPAASRHLAGIKVKATAHLQVKGAGKCFLQLRNIQACAVNEKIKHLNLLAPVSSGDACTPITGPEAEMIAEQLQKPIRFKWENGEVSMLQVDADDAYWSVNLKRGTIQPLNVNLQEMEALPDMHPTLRDAIKAVAPSAAQRSLGKYFRTMERDITGECESHYTIVEIPGPTPAFNVTKVRNYDNCRQRTMFQHGLMAAIDCKPCRNKYPVRTENYVKYELAGDRQNFLIKAAYQQGHLIFKPLATMDGQAMTITNQKLVLKDVIANPAPIAVGKSRAQKDPFAFELPSMMTELRDAAPAAPDAAAAAKIPAVKEFLEKIAQKLAADIIDPATTTMVADAVSQLRKIPAEALAEITIEYCQAAAAAAASASAAGGAAAASKAKCEIMLDALPTLGRSDVLPLLKRLINENIASPARAAFMANLMALTAEPAPRLITGILEWVKEPAIASHPQLKTSLLLAAGALTHALNKNYDANNVPKEIALPARHMIFEAWSAALTAASSKDEKLVALKAIGNAGMAEFIPLLEPSITDASEDPKVRAKAIYALRRLTPYAKYKVHALLVPVALNPAEPMDCRLAAITVTMHARPDAGVITALAQQIPNEPSAQVASYIYSYLKAAAESKLACNTAIAEAARAALKQIPVSYPGIPYSKRLNFEAILSHFHHLGAEVALDFVTHGASVLPETIVAKIKPNFAKSVFNLAEIGFESKGGQTVLRNLFGPESLWYAVLKGQMSFADILAPLMDANGINMEHIGEWWSQVTGREMPSFKADIFAKLFDTELRYFRLDTSTIQSMIRNAEAAIPSIFSALNSGVALNWVKSLALVDQAVMLPSPVGLPVSLNLTMIAIFNVAGDVKLEGASSLSQLVASAATITAKANLKPKIAYQLSGLMGVDLGPFKAMTSLRARASAAAPLAGEAAAEPASGKVQLTLDAPGSETPLLVADITPEAVVTKEYMQPRQGEFYEKMVKGVYNDKKALPIGFATEAGAEALGVAFSFSGKYAKAISPSAPFTPFSWPHALKVTAKPAADAPQAFEIAAAFVNPATAAGEAAKASILKAQTVSNSWFSISSAPTDITFDPVEVDPSISIPASRQLVLAVKTKGASAARFVGAQITATADASKFTKIQLDAQLGFKGKAAAAAAIAKYSAVFACPAVRGASADGKFAELKIAYGPQGNTQEYVRVKGFYKVLQTSEAEYLKQSIAEAVKPWIIDYKSPISGVVNSRPSRYSTGFGGSAEAGAGFGGAGSWGAGAAGSWEAGAVGAGANDLLPYAPAKPMQFKFEITYAPIPLGEPFTTYLPYVAYYAAPYLGAPIAYLPSAAATIRAEPNEARKVTAVITALPAKAMCEMIVKIPTHTFYVEGIPLPFSVYWHPFYSLSGALRKISNKAGMYGTCSMQADSMKTFDEMTYILPDTACETVLAEDCSSKKSFRVTAEKAAHTAPKKVVRLYIGTNKIEAAPSPSGALVVKVDGRPVALAEGVSVEVKDSRNKVVCSAIKKGASVELIQKKLNLKVETDCAKAYIELPMWFRNVTCGMCGNYDSEKVADVSGPNNEAYAHPEHAIADYVIPSATCDVNDLRNRFASTVITSAGCSPVSKTVYIERSLEGRPHACFSKEPIRVCPSKCHPAGQMAIEMPFHCLPANLPSTKQLLEDLKTGPLSPMTGKPTQITDTVITASTCS